MNAKTVYLDTENTATTLYMDKSGLEACLGVNQDFTNSAASIASWFVFFKSDATTLTMLKMRFTVSDNSLTSA